MVEEKLMGVWQVQELPCRAEKFMYKMLNVMSLIALGLFASVDIVRAPSYLFPYLDVDLIVVNLSSSIFKYFLKLCG